MGAGMASTSGVIMIRWKSLAMGAWPASDRRWLTTAPQALDAGLHSDRGGGAPVSACDQPSTSSLAARPEAAL